MLWSKQLAPDGSGNGVWQIAEDEAKLLALLETVVPPLAFKQLQMDVGRFRNTGRRCEWLAVRTLLAQCLGGGRAIAYDEASGKPFLSDHSYEISISHTRGFAALAWHPTLPVGIDIERRSDRVLRVVKKFVNTTEREALGASGYASPEGELVLWTAKEALYKAIGIRGLDFLNALTVKLSPAGTKRSTAFCKADGRTYEVLTSLAAEYVMSIVKPIHNPFQS